MEVIQPGLSQFVQEITDASHVGEARRRAVRYAEAIEMGEPDAGGVAIAVTELGTNAVKHARGGKIVCSLLSRNGSRGLGVLCLDKGPGIPDISRALEDGYSTSGTSGNGLGAVRRLSTCFDIYSASGLGTCVLAEFWPKQKRPKHSEGLRLGVVSLSMPGELVCGDGWAVRKTVESTLIMVVDGLGHGSFAAEAARAAEHVFAESKAISPVGILRDCHDALKKTRGAAAAIASISPDRSILSFAGLGNISGTIVTGQARRGLTSHNGTLGHRMHRLQEFSSPWDRNSMLIMHSDGLGSRWDLGAYPGVAGKHPGLIASVLYRDFDRARDDVTVLVATNSEE